MPGRKPEGETERREGDTTQERILKEAMKEFLDKGFYGASLRRISKNAGVTTGALYRYYDSKEALFLALTEEEARHILAMFTANIDDFEKLPASLQTERMLEVSNHGLDEMLDYIYDHWNAFRLLVDHAEGTPYADLIHQLAAREEESTYTYMETLASMGHQVEELDRRLVHMIASGLFTGIFETVAHGMSKEEAKIFVFQLRRFNAAGWSELLKVDFGKGMSEF